MRIIFSILFFLCLSQIVEAKMVTIHGEIQTVSGEKLKGRVDAYLVDYQNDEEPLFLNLDSLGCFEAQVRKRGYYGIRILSQNYKTHFQYIRFHQRKLRFVSFALKNRPYPLTDQNYFSILKSGYFIKSSIDVDTSLIIGKVINRMDEPIMFANVALYQNGILFQGVQADIDGEFSFTNIPTGVYKIEISYVGFPKFTLNEFEMPENGFIELIASLNQGVEIDVYNYYISVNIPIIHQDDLTQGTKFNQWEIGRSPHKN